jgi:hypothetical protein
LECVLLLELLLILLLVGLNSCMFSRRSRTVAGSSREPLPTESVMEIDGRSLSEHTLDWME